MRETILITAAVFLFGGCSLNEARPTQTEPTPTERPAATETPIPEEPPVGAESRNAPNVLGSKAERENCFLSDTGDNALLRSQTFAINFEPFKNACFVTAYNPESDDPPLESEISIYQHGEKIFNFPEQFTAGGCWIDAVGFRDINNDTLIDVIAMWKCATRGEPYRENVIYINNGKLFFTRPAANAKLAELNSVKEIAEYAARQKPLFAVAGAPEGTND